MRFLVDAQLPPALAQLIAERGYEAEHVFEIGPADAKDTEIWNYALQHDAVLVTKDQDFPQMTAWAAQPPAIVWVRVPNTRKAALLSWFGPLLPQIVAEVEAGNRLIELR